ncbi:MAG: ABC transporter ATP-binding protein [Omnitrophica WOR_2 bacterium]
MAEVKLEHISKRFRERSGRGEVLAVDDVSLTIQDGQFVVLLGPSGCGKTTTLRMIAGLEQPTGGNIYIGSRLVNSLPGGDRDIAFVFQFYALYPHLTGFDNISFPLRAQQVKKAEINQRVHEVSRRLQIERLLPRKPGQMSTGEQQRVALGRAMIRQPKVFLLDEPLTNLDAKLRGEMRAELKHLHGELGTTMIHVTHDQTEALSMGDRIIVMHQGRIQQDDSPLNIYNHPANLFVAGFIGTPPMNFLDVHLSDGSHPCLQAGSGAFRLPVSEEMAQKIHAKAGGDDLILGVRAEDIQLNPAEALPDENSELRGEIVVVEALGDENIFTLFIGPHRIQVKTEPAFTLSTGRRVGVIPDLNRIHVFQKTTQEAIF